MVSRPATCQDLLSEIRTHFPNAAAVYSLVVLFQPATIGRRETLSRPPFNMPDFDHIVYDAQSHTSHGRHSTVSSLFGQGEMGRGGGRQGQQAAARRASAPATARPDFHFNYNEDDKTKAGNFDDLTSSDRRENRLDTLHVTFNQSLIQLGVATNTPPTVATTWSHPRHHDRHFSWHPIIVHRLIDHLIPHVDTLTVPQRTRLPFPPAPAQPPSRALPGGLTLVRRHPHGHSATSHPPPPPARITLRRHGALKSVITKEDLAKVKALTVPMGHKGAARASSNTLDTRMVRHPVGDLDGKLHELHTRGLASAPAQHDPNITMGLELAQKNLRIQVSVHLQDLGQRALELLKTIKATHKKLSEIEKPFNELLALAAACQKISAGMMMERTN
ncbi:hypothetical protein F5883DRAFT_529766 [Diaporthe sp. PMI_573]|nr:hypothetical protein F5883DRAFT_529766 [Diaporthaceae sp. PMI_573]